MSYRVDSDVRHGYGDVVKVSPHPTSASELSEIIMNFGVSNKNLAVKEKSKEEALICQFVSNCKTTSKRNVFVKTILNIDYL